MKNLSRRDFLQGMGVATLGAAAGIRLSLDAAPAYAQSVATGAAFYRTALGDFELTVIRDAVATIPLSTLVANAESGEVSDVLTANGFPASDQPNNFKLLLVNTGENLALFDTGLGAPQSQLMPTLELIGVAPEDISTVILSHWHPDHIGGVGGPAFPNARYVFSQTEWDFLQANSGNQGLQGALATLQPISESGQLEFYADGEEVLPGIQAMATPGHTPGHHGFVISSGGMSLFNTVDAIVHPVISVQRTDWHFGFDADPNQAVETRRALLDQIASENMLMFGYHFPFPGIGYVAATDEANSWRFTPFSY